MKMIKKFMIEKVDHQQLTDTSGTICFHIMDNDNGKERIVQASTRIENNEPQSIITGSMRELPLIETLFQNRDKRVIEIEFSRFNALYDRDSHQMTPLAYKTAMNMNNKAGLAGRLIRFLQRN